ncbi:hypothetical protein [Aquamicrobium terrae]|uniref:PepSY domain-containing protein n=1 Tax=Aquamicrobium terrae TaxID=1324945 RepID=A0ABV2N5Z4_9HYPH
MNNATDRQSGAGRGLIAISLFLSSVLAACQSSPTPDQMTRTAVETAPADLQLICANAAAQSRGVDTATVLPTSSRKLDARTYQVQLNASGTTMNCVVDDQGMVSSVTAA